MVVEPAPITDVFDQLQAKDRELEKSINRIRLEKVKDLKKVTPEEVFILSNSSNYFLHSRTKI